MDRPFADNTDSCLALFALLTPLGAGQLLNSRRLDASPRIRAPLAHMLDLGMTRQLESRVVVAGDLPAKLAAFGAWLEQRAHQRGSQNRAALRAARAAMRLCAEPTAATDRVADERHVARMRGRRWPMLRPRWGLPISPAPAHRLDAARVRAHAGVADRGGGKVYL